jgi:hypothetical protein
MKPEAMGAPYGFHSQSGLGGPTPLVADTHEAPLR